MKQVFQKTLDRIDDHERTTGRRPTKVVFGESAFVDLIADFAFDNTDLRSVWPADVDLYLYRCGREEQVLW